MKIVSITANCIFSKIDRLNNGFPVPSLEMKASQKRLLSEVRSNFSNVIFCGRGAGEGFYLQDIIQSTFKIVSNLKD